MNTNLQLAFTTIGLTPGAQPIPVIEITDLLNSTRSDLSFTARGVGRYLKAVGFVRTVRVINGIHTVCYFVAPKECTDTPHSVTI